LAITISREAIEAMGFTEMAPETQLRATFRSLHVFEVKGFTLDAGAAQLQSGMVDGNAYQVAIAASVNVACRALVADDFTDDERAWAGARRCEPPYAVLLVGPTGTHECQGTHSKREEGGISTYDGFGSARDELLRIEARVVPAVVSALTVALASKTVRARFRTRDRALLGRTLDQTLVRDVRIGGSAAASLTHRLPPTEIADSLLVASQLASRLNAKVSEFLHLAFSERDPLKRFLFFFLAIEVQTNATFRLIDHDECLRSLVMPATRLETATRELFSVRADRVRTLVERFVWCSLCVWTQVDDSDVAGLRMVKKARDRIAHGVATAPDTAALAEAERLATKLQHHQM